MSRALLDINVLLALLDRDHVDHARSTEWFDAEVADGWASCALTQNGFVRIISQPRYPSPVSPTRASGLLRRAVGTALHEFWSCAVSLLDRSIIDTDRLHGPKQVTDAYLLALATVHGGRFATFDRAVPMDSVVTATEANLVVI